MIFRFISPSFLLVLIFGVVSFKGMAQDTPEKGANQLNFQVIPPGPEASALGSFVDIPASLYTGKASIGFPVYTLKSGSLTLPISLDYNSSGVKVEDISPFTGSNWSLQAGGMISRSIRGFADEDGNGYFSQVVKDLFLSTGPFDDNSLACRSVSQDNTRYGNLESGLYDLQPDSWFFNFGGYSGRIVFTHDKEPIFIPRQNLTVIQLPFKSDGTIQNWIIKDEKGTTYTFAQKGRTKVTNTCQKQLSPSGHPVDSPTTWQLVGIESASTLDKIEFEYDYETLTYSVFTSQNDRHILLKNNQKDPGFKAGLSAPCYSTFKVIESKLSKVTSSSGYTITFIRDMVNPRTDVSGGYRLQKIEVKYKDTFVKGYELFHTTEGEYLMLNAIKQYDNSGSYMEPGTKYTYFPGILHHGRSSFSRDHWGYFNDADNKSLIPPNSLYKLDGANRESDLNSTEIGALKRVTYPTGGYSEYEYELNTYSNTGSVKQTNTVTYGVSVVGEANNTVRSTQTFTLTEATDITMKVSMPCQNQSINCNFSFKRNGTSVGTINGQVPAGEYTIEVTLISDENMDLTGLKASILVSFDVIVESLKEATAGGLRVKKITSYDGLSNTLIKAFNYTSKSSGLTSGKIMSKPNYAYLYNYSFGICDPQLGALVDGGANCLERASSSNISLGTTQGSYVGYDQVTVYSENKEGEHKLGKSVSEFTNFISFDNSGAYPFIYNTDYEYKNGLLLTQTEYKFIDGNYAPIKKVENNYSFTDLYTIHGAQVAAQYQGVCPGCSIPGEADNSYLTYAPGSDQTERVSLISSKESLLEGNTLVETSTYYQYDPVTYLPIRIFTVDSKGTVHYTLNKYPNNLPAGTMSTQLTGLNVSAALIEQQTWQSASNLVTESLVAAPTYSPDLNQYQLTHAIYTSYNNLALPTGQFILRSAKPVKLQDWTESVGDILPNDSKYVQEDVINQYDTYGNIISYTKRKEQIPNAFLWSYTHTLPIAHAINAEYTEIFVQDFEQYSGATESETNAHTGRFYWNSGSFTVGFTPPNAKVYLMDYFYFQNNQWIAVTGVPFQSSISTSGSRLDNIRIYPQNAMLTSYTYIPGWGISGQIDAQGKMQRYQYDTFGRLTLIRDHKGQILKQYRYHYQGQDALE
ncbi:hypothetical protein QNI19_12240 [Cytophagaceae bacterium DM2B3-1]|uniref:YD repeat-containing protein n=1 Tax=Xanthocytophaga flava TaxID=3048013 RepID=A0ABT7CJ11_9BACT|nr:hypothetical protein [Xanthocytophaga flavus]MDJ1493703.1 hypothetical protein [Xanthocytophaga flavus]